MIESKATKMLRVFVRLSIEDNEKKNVELPTCTLNESVFINDDKHAFVFLKIDPSKQEWGDIKMEVTSEYAATTSNFSSSSGGTSMGGYMGMGIGTGTSSSSDMMGPYMHI